MRNESSNNSARKQQSDYQYRPIILPHIKGKLVCNTHFIVPGLVVSKQETSHFIRLAELSSNKIETVHLERLVNNKIKQEGTSITFAFYASGNMEKNRYYESAFEESFLLRERFLSLLTFCSGVQQLCVNQSVSVYLGEGKWQTGLHPKSRSSTPKIAFDIPNRLMSKEPIPEWVFSALFWLRRGMADRDPIEAFSALWVCLEILASKLVSLQPIKVICNRCKNNVLTRERGATALVKELLIKRLGAEKRVCNEMEKARNAIIAHGGKPISANVLLELTDLKFDAADFAFAGLKLALDMKLDSPPTPPRSFYITDAFMHMK